MCYSVIVGNIFRTESLTGEFKHAQGTDAIFLAMPQRKRHLSDQLWLPDVKNNKASIYAGFMDFFGNRRYIR
jgi:hypothetical protein